jgi:hypothetical protein
MLSDQRWQISLSDPRRSVVRVNIGGGPHAPRELPSHQNTQSYEAGRNRPTQQGVEDPVPAVGMGAHTVGVGHCRPPSVKAAKFLHLACGQECDLPTMGTETLQLVPAVSVGEHPSSVGTLRCSLTWLTLANRADSLPLPGRLGNEKGALCTTCPRVVVVTTANSKGVLMPLDPADSPDSWVCSLRAQYKTRTFPKNAVLRPNHGTDQEVR